MENTIFIIIVALVVFDFVFEQWLHYLNDRYRMREIPPEGKDIYPADEYKRSQLYEKDKSRFSLITSAFSLITILLLLFLGGFAFLDNVLRSYTAQPVWLALLFFGILGLASDLINTPFSVYGIFVIEQKYGFNKTTPKTYILDKLKSWLLGIVLGAPLLAFIVWLFGMGGHYTWVIAWGGISLFMIFITFFYSTLIVPLFNKQTPLPEGELKEAINELAVKTGFRLKDVFVMDGSKRSAKANAYFTGFGSKKRIVLYDTLIEQLNTSELLAVLAHEIGHYKKKHVLINMVISLAETGLFLFILSLFVQSPVLSKALGVIIPSFHVGVITFGIIYGFITTIPGIFMNNYSRANEYEADRYAALHFEAQALISGLKKLSLKNLSNLMPHPWYVFVYYSHPPLLKRIKALQNFKK